MNKFKIVCLVKAKAQRTRTGLILAFIYREIDGPDGPSIWIDDSTACLFLGDQELKLHPGFMGYSLVLCGEQKLICRTDELETI